MTLATLALRSGPVELRRARLSDVDAIVELLADDDLGRARERPEMGGDANAEYRRAFGAIDADAGELLVVAIAEREVVGTSQLSLIPGLTRRGALRAQLEGVRIRRDHRNSGVGAAMLRWAIEEARRRGCRLVQPTTDKSRADAQRFYASLGFVATHEGLKLSL